MTVRATKLLFDLTATQPLRHGAHGGGEYAKTVFHAIAAMQSKSVGVYWNPSRPLEDDISGAVRNANFALHPVRNTQELQSLLIKLRPERVYSALPYHLGDVNFGDAEFVATIHGIRPIEMPSDCTASRYARNSLERVKTLVRHYGRYMYVARMRAKFAALLSVRSRLHRIIVPSEYTRRSLLRAFPFLEENRVHVLYSPSTGVSGMPPTQHHVDDFAQDNKRRFILLVSGDRWVKNSYRALSAIERLYQHLDQASQWPVLVTGNMPLAFPSRWAQKFRFVGSCSRATLAGFYANAGLLLYPSLNEGFGYPPIEAMSYGTPVLAGAIAAVPEIAAGGAGYFCPQSIEDIQIRLWSFLADPTYRDALARDAKSRYEVVLNRQIRDLDNLCHLLLR